MVTNIQTGPGVRILANIQIDGVERSHTITRFPCSIGRDPGCDLVIPDPSISSRHAMLSIEPGNILSLSDIGSTNGMYVNSERVERCELKRELKVQMGNVKMRLRVENNFLNSNAEINRTDAAGNCFYRREGREHGPFTVEMLKAMAKDKRLRRDDLIWLDGSTAWLRAEYVPGIFSEDTAAAKDKSAEAESSSTQDEIGDAGDAQPVTPTVSVPETAAPPSKYVDELLKMPRRRTRGDIVCPHCWHIFDVEDFLYIARHQSLTGDPVLGPEAQQRFLPSKFTPEGHAVDSAGLACPDVACPRCHLRIPQTAGEMPPLFISIVGATASGKSYLLTSMIWELRNMLSRNFAVSFTDTDAINNQIINDFEDMLYLNSDMDELVALSKTELQGELYNQVMLDSMIINLPKPFMFSLTPAEHHPQYQQAREKMSRTLVLYDNAGEHFEPGMDAVDNPTTRHLLHSDTLLFLFDPTKDVRFRERCHSDDPQLTKGGRVQRQEVLLTEMINRIKKYSGMRAGVKTAKTLIIVLPKSDIWIDLIAYKLAQEPWQWDAALNSCALNIEEIKNASFAIRNLLEQLCPELVSTAESFAGNVLYLPNSALGCSPELHETTGMLGIRPRRIKPFWISVPMLYFFHEHGLIPELSAKLLPKRELTKVDYKISGDFAFVQFPGRAQPLQVPLFYIGCRLRCPHTGQWFELKNSSNSSARRQADGKARKRK